MLEVTELLKVPAAEAPGRVDSPPTSTTSAQPAMGIAAPIGAAVARSTQCRYAGLSSSPRWCSAVGYNQMRRAGSSFAKCSTG